MRWIFGGEKKPKQPEKELSPMEKMLVESRKIKNRYERIDELVKISKAAAGAGDHTVAIASLRDLVGLSGEYTESTVDYILEPQKGIFTKEGNWTAELVSSYLSFHFNNDRRKHTLHFKVLESFAQWGQLEDVKKIIGLFKKDITVGDVAQHVSGGLARNNLYSGSLDCFLMFTDAELVNDETFYRLVIERYEELKKDNTPASAMIRAMNIFDRRKTIYHWHHDVMAKIRKLWGLKVVEGE